MVNFIKDGSFMLLSLYNSNGVDFAILTELKQLLKGQFTQKWKLIENSVISCSPSWRS